jgi:pimeloyl-ACP methyl ester carboxylesterase
MSGPEDFDKEAFMLKMHSLNVKVQSDPSKVGETLKNFYSEQVSCGDKFTADLALIVRSIDEARASQMDSQTVTTVTSPKNAHTMTRYVKVFFGIIGALIVCGVVLRFALRWFPDTHKPGEVRSGWVSSSPRNKPVAIVFIHGVFGTKDTWSGGKVDFTQLLAEDPDIKAQIDVYEFGYYSPFTGHAQTITDSSVKLHRDLEHDQVFETHKKVVFVAHSMGGLILRKYLIDNQQNVQDKVAMMYFFATPTDGSELATLAKNFSNNPQLGGLVPLDANEALASIQTGWYGAQTLSQKPSYCAFETLPTENLVKVVSEASATHLCNRQPEPIAADHIGIIKPESRNAESYVVLIDALKETALASQLPVATVAQSAAVAPRRSEDKSAKVNASVSVRSSHPW